MGRTFLVLSLFVITFGCAHKVDRSSSNSAGSAFAVIQQGTADAQFANMHARQHADPVGREWCDAATHSHEDVQLAATAGIANHDKEMKEHWQLVRESRDEHARDKYLGWQTRHYLWLIGIIWAGIGIGGLVLGLMGLAGPSAFVMRLLPLSNVFALVRDRWMISRGQSLVVPVMATNAAKPSGKGR